MKVSEAIKLLESKVVRSEENLKHFPKESQGYAANEARIIAYNIAINKLEQIDEPQGEKVEVPDFIAKLIRKYKAKKETLVCSIANLNRQSDEYKWYVDNAEIYERAWVNGYTVKPKQWVVKKGKDCVLTSFTFFDEQSVNYDSNSYGKDYLIFTDKAKAEAVATLVDGSVEEEQK